MANTKTHAKGVPSDPDATLRPTSRDQVRLPLAALPFLAPPLMPGDLGQLGHYRILRVLGQGAMGMVLQGEDPSLGRAVAIKVMLPELAARSDMRSRFLAEARAVAGLQHDNIVAIFHVGEDQGVPFFVMPRLEGLSLEEYLRRGKSVSIGQAVRIAKDVGRGLATAHEKGLIHRDIKPGNLWVDASAGGRIKILDFGVARPVQQDHHLTHVGTIIGTPAYMSPEQMNGRAEPRSDLYSLGAVLYRALAGRLPFAERESLDLLVAVATQEPPPLSKLAPHVPADFADLIMRLLAKNVGSRPESARAFLEELKEVAKGSSGQMEATLTLGSEEPAPSVEERERERRERPAPLAGADAISTHEIRKSRRPKRRRKAGQWKQPVLLSGLALALLAICVALVVWVPKLATGKGEQVEPEQPPKRSAGKVLFDGKNMAEWEERGKSNQWSVRDGLLVCRGHDKGLLQSRTAFSNFEVELEWRLPEGGRAGVFVRHASRFPPKAAESGLEIGIVDAIDTTPDVYSCGAIVGRLCPKEIPLARSPAWNHYRIRCEGERVQVVFNQRTVVDTEKQGRIARLASRGTITLHHLGAPVEFRNIVVKELP